MAIAQDVIDRIKFGQFIARNGTFVSYQRTGIGLKKMLK